MKKAIIGLSVCAFLIGGCTTMKALETAGDQFSKGNIGTGLYMGTIGVGVSAIYDVFTLGGALSPDQAADTWTQAAAQKEQAKATQAAAQEEQAKAQHQQQQQAKPSAMAAPENKPHAKANAPVVATKCVKASQVDSGGIHFSLKNICTYEIYVKYYLAPDSIALSESWARLAPGKSEITNVAYSRSTKVHYFACRNDNKHYDGIPVGLLQGRPVCKHFWDS